MNIKLTYKVLSEAIENTQGNISKIQRKLAANGIKAAWHTINHALLKPKEHFYYWLDCAPNDEVRAKREKQLEELTARFYDEQETMLDVAESGLMEAVLAKEPWAIKFALTTKGKKRGYDTTPTIKIDDTDPLNINLQGDLMTAADLTASQNVEVPDYGSDTGGQE